MSMSTGGLPLGEDVPVYVISVAAQLSGLHPQTLRQYDRLGLVSPGRSRRRGSALLRPRHRAPARGAAADRDGASGSTA